MNYVKRFLGILVVTLALVVCWSPSAKSEAWESWEDSLATEDVVGACDSIPAVFVGSDFENIRVFVDTIHDQTEPSIAISPLDPNTLLIGTNTTRWKLGGEVSGRQVNHEGSYYTSNGG